MIIQVRILPLAIYTTNYSGGLLRAIRTINNAKQAKGLPKGVVADVHPSRPDYRGFALGEKIVSLQADPSFTELESAGATVSKQSETHTVLDNLFLISGEIPRQTPYETGLKGAMRYDAEEKDWFSDESISDERFLMCNLKGMSVVLAFAGLVADPTRQGDRNVYSMQSCRCRQRRQACSRPPSWVCAPPCRHWRISSCYQRA